MHSHEQILYALVFAIFGTLHNAVAIYSSGNPNVRQHLHTLQLCDASVIVSSVDILKQMLQQQQEQPANANDEHAELRTLFASIFKILLRTIDLLSAYDQLTGYAAAATGNSGAHATLRATGSSVAMSLKPRRCRMNLRQMHCRQLETHMSSCFFQGLLFGLLPQLSSELQEYTMHYLLRAGTCCCHYTLDTYAICLQVIVRVAPNYQKCTYKFLYGKVLHAIFLRDCGAQGKRRDAPHCAKCDAKLKSSEFHMGLLQLYRQLYEQHFAAADNTQALHLLLKHLLHIAHLLTHDVAAGIVAQIVLPVFRHFKAKVMEQHKQSGSPTTPQSPTQKPDNSRLHLHINTPPITSAQTLNSHLLKTVHECLNVFAIYLNDIRLIKAFYNEENIKHLEELLDAPELISGICDLIKIGIDNLTFLGDNSLEQAALSRRLITLQLNSSDRAAQLFNALLQRFAKCSKSARARFWLEPLQPGWQQQSHLRPLDIFNITALQWTLNYELLKTSQFFYNEFAKIYSIVLDEEEDAAAAADSSSATSGAREAHNHYLQHGDKTIIDILRLNYNALSCFLIPPRRMKNPPQRASGGAEQPQHMYIFSPVSTVSPLQQCASPTASGTYKAVDCLSSSLESLLSSADFNSLQAQHSVSAAISSTAVVSGAVESEDTYTYDKVTQFYEGKSSNTFLNKLQQQQPIQVLAEPSLLMQESIVLFDIRHQNQLSASAHSGSQSPSSSSDISTNAVSSWSLLPSGTFCSTTDALSTVLADPKTHDSVPQNKEGLIAKLFGMVGSFFSSSLSTSALSLGAADKESSSEDELLDADLSCFYAPHGDGKKLLLKLFEATMAICVKGYQNEEMEKMQKHLRKLKAVILGSASAHWQLHADENARENSVLQTLQTLLKIAELSHTLNEPAAVASNAGSAVLAAADDDESAAGEPPSAAAPPVPRPRTRSLYSAHTHGYPSHLLSPPLPARGATASAQPPLRPLSGDSGDTNEFLSTRASLACGDSEFEFSENDQEDYYLTADEGYEADAEIPAVTDSDAEVVAADVWHSFRPTSRYRTHVLHDGLCRLVVEILMELSRMCTRNPAGWCDNLAQLANRLFVIREHLGGPLFLLRGFTPILTCNDARLQELQQSILELIVDLNTPDLLCTYFRILATKSAPVEILIKYMHFICGSSLRKAQPSVELEFPVLIDGKCISTSDVAATEQIDRIRSYHLHCQAITPFTRAPCIIPITHARLWSNDGLTLSLWLRLKSSQRHKSCSQLIDDDARSSSEEYQKTHIVSLGTNQAMLSIYVNNSMHLVFETCKPNAEVQAPLSVTETSSYKSASGNNATLAETKTATTASRTAAAVGANAAGVATSPFRNALKQTKLVLLNSFSNMHLFHAQADGASYFEGCSVDLKYFRLPRKKWTHLTFAVEAHADRLDVLLSINGLDQHAISLPFRNLHNLIRTHTFQMLSLGDGYTAKSPNNSACNNYTESRSTLETQPLGVNISNVLLFNRKFVERETILHLTAMGPDFSELIQCQVGNWKPNYGFLNVSKMCNANFGHFGASMKLLKQSHILTYTAQQPELVMGYNTGMETYNTSYGTPYGLILYGELTQNQLPSLQTATLLSGGLSCLLYLFARVVEATSHSDTQAMALDLFLSVALSDTQLYAEFLRNDYISLIGYVIRTERCSKDVQLLRSIVNNACTQVLISKHGDSLHVNENTVASLVYPRLLTTVLHRYSDWHRSGAEQSDVLDMLFQCVLALTREKHPHRDFNMEQLNNSGFMRVLLNLCKVYVIESPNPIYISPCAARSFASIIAVFAGSPPSPSLMDEIMKLLLLLHKPSECYITHDRAHFYFLLTTQLPTKEKSIATSSLSRVAAPFRRAERSGVAVPVRPSTADAEVARRAARIDRLRKLHAANSTYRRVLHEFEENLEHVADCSKLNKNALRLLSPVEVNKWRVKFKRGAGIGGVSSSPKRNCALQKTRHASTAAPLHPAGSSHHATPQKIARKRLRPQSTSSRPPGGPHGAEKRSRVVERHSEGSLHALAASLAGTFNTDYDESSHFNEVFSLSATATQQQQQQPPQRRSKSLTKTDFYSSAGIIALQEGLFTLLKDFLCLLPDNAVEEVLKHYIKVEFLLVLSNHRSCSVRAAIIKLLAALTRRLSANDLLTGCKSFYPQHLANQLSIFPTDAHMFEACIEWVTGVCGSLDVIMCNDTLRIHHRFGLHALVAIASKATVQQQTDYADRAFRVLRSIYISDTEEQQALIDVGLLQCCLKALYHFYTKSNVPHLRTEDAILTLLTTVGEKSLKSVGHINVIWDILNIFLFYQEKQPMAIVKAFRSAQSQLLLNWLHMFFEQVNVFGNFKVTTLTDCSLTLAETKTRLDLLLDHCSQFFTVFCEANYTPTDSEIKLFELLVSYCIATNQRCNNFIAWGLLPSRPRELRAFIVNALWLSCQDNFVPAIICDGKMIKSFLWLCLLEDLEQPIEHLEPLCRRLGINEKDSISNLGNELGRIELSLCTVSAKQKTILGKTVYKFEPLAVSCIESSMVLTRRVAELQNAERKLIMSQMKDYDETYTYTKWLEIIRRMTHEGAPWHSKDRVENSWELDDTEGPSRVHTRLRRCHLDIDKRFFMQDFDADNGVTESNPSLSNSILASRGADEYTRPLDYLISSYDQQLNVSLNSQILYNFAAKFLPVDGEIDGEIIVTDHKLYFLATYRCKYFYVSCDISNITEIWLKRYQHQEKAFEIFLDTNQSLFFSLHNQSDWKIMRDVFCDKIVTPPDQSKLSLITQQWREGLLTNWEYLMTLNQIAGRTYNDLMQYPVFPWILSNYTGEVLDLTSAQNFRKLEKPIAVQHEENEQHYIGNYTYINNTMTTMGSLTLKPYHYSSHYSNSGTVLHFLVRVPPFTSYFLRYQDNNFDLPDRTFHALGTTWSLASRDSPTDVKELIPEFFCLPELFENFERFNFGCRQSGERVEDVLLPPWCLRDPRLFVLIHRQALESELVRNNLHQWVDLIFGFKQMGESAVEAINVFHPATYSVFLESEISDPIERKAVETMVKTYGQMPRQLFKTPHAASKLLNYCLGEKEMLQNVRGLRWGVYLGSPQLPPPKLGNIYKLPDAEQLVSFNSTNVVYALPEKACVMQGAEVDTFNVVYWGCVDRIVRIQPLNKSQSKYKNLLQNNVFDEITACGAEPNSNQLWFGHKSGSISVYKCAALEASGRTPKSRQSYVRGLRLSYNSAFRKIITKSGANGGGGGGKTDADVDGEGSTNSASSTSLPTGEPAQRDGADLSWSGPTVLVRHTDAISCIHLSVEFKIAVSAGRDGIAVIWDLNDWSYVRTIERPAEIHHSPITLVAISPTLGDIATVHTIPQHSSSSAGSEDNQRERAHEQPPTSPAQQLADECFEVTEENLDDFVNVSINPNGKSILRLHTVNARYVQHIVHEDRILAVCYSYIKEGVGVNVIATAVEGGVVRLWSSWNLSFVREIITGISNIRSVVYSTHQHLVVLTKESRIQVWETDGLYGTAPKFPQIAYK